MPTTPYLHLLRYRKPFLQLAGVPSYRSNYTLKRGKSPFFHWFKHSGFPVINIMKRTVLLLLALIIVISGCQAVIDFAPVSPLPLPLVIELPTHIDSYQIVGDTRGVSVTCLGRDVAVMEQYPDRILVVCAGATPTLTIVPLLTDTPIPTEFATPVPTELATFMPSPVVPLATLTPTRVPTATPNPATRVPTRTPPPTRTPTP